MTNYNDGKWHGWNGGECPVHPKSRLEWCRFTGIGVTGLAHQGFGDAKCLDWNTLTAFRVIKQHREPREWWITQSPQERLIFSLEKNAKDAARDIGKKAEIIHVREVLE